MMRTCIAWLILLTCLSPSVELDDPPAHCQFKNTFREKETREVFDKALNGKVLRDRLLKTPWQSLQGLTVEDFKEDVILPDPTDYVTSIARYLLLEKLHDDDVDLYIKVLRTRPDHAMPIAYTPTVGFACQVNHVFLEKARGLYLPVRSWLTEAEAAGDAEAKAAQYTDKMKAALELCDAPEAWPELNSDGAGKDGYGSISVITDSSRILGLGDQGAGGSGIPAGKISLYIAAAGFRHQRALPVVVDFGIDSNETKWFAETRKTYAAGERPHAWCTDEADATKKTIIDGIDFGTCQKLTEPNYFGCRGAREKVKTTTDFEEKVAPFMDVFVKSFKAKWPKMVLQWEDWHTDKASKLLKRHRHVTCTKEIQEKDDIAADSKDVVSFNDDIQGTGSMLYGALLAAVKANKQTINEQKLLFIGGGSAGIGVADMVVKGMLFAEGKSPCDEEAAKQARKNFVIVSGDGVLSHGVDLDDDQRPFGDVATAYDKEEWRCPKKNGRVDGPCVLALQKRLIREFKPTVLVGSTGVGGVFDEETLRAMKKVTWDNPESGRRQRPIIFALSNPMSSAECTAADAYKYTDGTALFAAGTKMKDYKQGGNKPTFYPAQANNFFVFPGVGYGAAFGSFAKGVPEEVFIVASQTLANLVTMEELRHGSILPAVNRILEVNGAVSDNILAYGERIKVRFAEADDPTCEAARRDAAPAKDGGKGGKGGSSGGGDIGGSSNGNKSNMAMIVGFIILVVVGTVGGYVLGMHQANSSKGARENLSQERGIEMGSGPRMFSEYHKRKGPLVESY